MATGLNLTFSMATPMVVSIQVTVFKFNGLGRRMHTRLMNISKKNLDLRLVFDNFFKDTFNKCQINVGP